MRRVSLGLALVALAHRRHRGLRAAEDSAGHPDLRRGNRERRHRQRLCRRVGIHGRRRRRHVRLQRRRLSTTCCLPAATSPAKFYRNASTRGGALKFEAETSGLELDKVTGAYPLDIDSDGITDLVLLRVGENVVMRGLGGCRFERANEAWGFDGGDAWSTALAATWERGADWPTIAIGNYIDRREEMSPWGSCTDNWLHRPRAGREPRRFRRRHCRSSPASARCRCCSPTGTGPARRACASPTTANITKAARSSSGTSSPARRRRSTPPTKVGSSCASGAWASPATISMRDGYPEYFLTSMADNKLQTLAAVPQGRRAASPTYADVAFAKGVTAHRPYTGGDWHPSTAWHAQFEDVNNDGLVDLFIAKGNVAEMPDFADEGPQQSVAAAAATASSRKRATRQASPASPYRAARRLTDFNLDGLLDLVVVNRWEKRADLAQHQPAMPAAGSRSSCSSRPRTATRSAPGSRSGAMAPR